MKTGINKIIRHSTEESGVAIIIAIGFLAVILAVVISFANMSIVNKKLSDNYNSVQEARMTAQTAYSRALSVIDYVKNSEESISMNKLYSKYEGIQTDPDPDTAIIENLMQTMIDGKHYTPNYTPSSGDSIGGPYWQYLPYDAGNDTPITSRFAYVILANPGKIDPTAAIDTGATGIASSEIETDSTSYNVLGRPGRDINEVFLRSLDDDGNWLQNEYLKKMSSENVIPATTPVGLLTPGERWSSFVTLFSADKLNIEGTETADTFQTVFLLDTPPDIEAFWIDSNGDEQRENSELYHRFNLTRNDWNIKGTADELTVTKITDIPVLYNEASGSKTNSIYWLRNWNSLGGFSSTSACKNQVVANLIDYCDSDTESTTDNTNAPTYNGNEKVPYINEIKFIFKGWLQGDGVDTTSYLQASSIELELVNMYSASASNLRGEISLNGSYRMYPPATGSQISVSKVFNLDFSTITDSYTVGQLTDILLASQSDNENCDSKIVDFNINLLKIKLTSITDPAKLYDYSYITNSATESIDLTLTGDTGTACLNFQVIDPRQNLLETEWSSDSVFCLEADFISDSDTLDTNNINYKPQDGNDPETDTDPWNLSTSFIRNAPMESPWELGFIHRGNKWETINLKKYNRNITNEMIGTGGGSDYSDGDANILDQVKMTDRNYLYGKINLNTDSDSVLKALFQEIYVGSDISSSKGPGDTDGASPIDKINAKNIADLILNINGTNDTAYDPLLCRSQILNAIEYSDFNDSMISNKFFTQNTDAMQEEIIGKFINLTKSETPNIFNIVIIAQKIQDNGGRGKDIKINGVNSRIGRYDEGGDRILATQKVLTTILYTEDPETQTAKFQILRFKYLND